VRETSQLGVEKDGAGKRDEVADVLPRATEHERGHEEHEQSAIGRPVEPVQPDRKPGCYGERRGDEQRRPQIQIARWAPLGAAAALGVGLRVPFLHAPLTADEGGYAEIARLWRGGAGLYTDLWVDRPQGLELVYRAALGLHLGSLVGLRALAAGAAAAVIVLTGFVGLQIGATLTAWTAAILLACLGSSPWIESFTLSGELLASLCAVSSFLAFLRYLSGRRAEWLVAAGLLTGCAVMTKQSGFDAGLAAGVYLLVVERRRSLAALATLLGSALVPIALGAGLASSPGAWWSEVVAYRWQGDSIATGSIGHRLGQLAGSLPAALIGLGLLAALAVYGWRRSPLLLRLWVAAAGLGVLAGGNFHAHYYVQLAPPLSLAAAVGLVQSPRLRPRLVGAVTAAGMVATAAVTAPLWFAAPASQARAIWPADRHLVTDGAVASFLRGNTLPGQPVAVLWAAADVYYLADRPPAVRYLWFRNVEAVPGALNRELDELRCRPPALLALVQAPDAVDRSGGASRLIDRAYRRVAIVAGIPIYRPRRSFHCSTPRAVRTAAPLLRG